MSDREDKNYSKSVSLAFQGLAFGVVICFLGLISLNIGGRHFGLLFLPSAAVLLWPAGASVSWSLVFVFALGLLFDILTAGPIGVWALSFLVMFMAVGSRGLQFTRWYDALLGFVLTAMFMMVAVFVLGRFTIGSWPDVTDLIVHGLASLTVFPVINGLSKIIGRPSKARS